MTQVFALPIARIRASAAADALRRFVRETDASLTVEAMIILPFYLQFYISTFAFFDAFRTAVINEKAAYTISDVIARRNAGADVSTAYIVWLNDLFDYLLENRAATWIRVSSITNTGTEAVPIYTVEWSVATRGRSNLSNADMTLLAPRLPVMPTFDTVILVETTTQFGLSYTTPPASPSYLFSSLGTQNLTTFIFTRPRFAPRIGFSG